MIGHSGLLVAGSMLGFAVLHSLLAGIAPKAMLKRFMGERLVEGWYRLGYNVLAAITFLPVLALLLLAPDESLYHVPLPWSLVLYGVQASGFAGVVMALAAVDVWGFMGFRQALAYLSGDPLPLPTPPLVKRGLYALSRHPIYFFSLLAIWAVPSMTTNLMAFNLVATLYVAVGSLIEERRLERLYGDAYRAYRRCVSWLIPWPARDCVSEEGDFLLHTRPDVVHSGRICSDER